MRQAVVIVGSRAIYRRLLSRALRRHLCCNKKYCSGKKPEGGGTKK
jgi:hypothetical protein